MYCYARPTHAYLGLSPGLDFESRLFHKPDAPQQLARELAVSRGRAVRLLVNGGHLEVVRRGGLGRGPSIYRVK